MPLHTLLFLLLKKRLVQLLNLTWGRKKREVVNVPSRTKVTPSATKRTVFNLIVFICFNEMFQMHKRAWVKEWY